MKNILVIHGPNLNLLGKREPDVYGKVTLESINKEECESWADAMVINPAAYTHTSVAIREAISAVKISAVEVHLSNIFKREEFRHKSYISPVSAGGIFGFGKDSYILGFLAAVNISKTKR